MHTHSATNWVKLHLKNKQKNNKKQTKKQITHIHKQTKGSRSVFYTLDPTNSGHVHTYRTYAWGRGAFWSVDPISMSHDLRVSSLAEKYYWSSIR